MVVSSALTAGKRISNADLPSLNLCYPLSCKEARDPALTKYFLSLNITTVMYTVHVSRGPAALPFSVSAQGLTTQWPVSSGQSVVQKQSSHHPACTRAHTAPYRFSFCSSRSIFHTLLSESWQITAWLPEGCHRLGTWADNIQDVWQGDKIEELSLDCCIFAIFNFKKYA